MSVVSLIHVNLMSGRVVPGGLLVVIEGIDGSGKTVLADRLFAHVGARGFVVYRSREPTAGPWGQQLRASAAQGRLPLSKEVDLLIRDRRHHVDTLIAPALRRGAVVVLDRYFPSMIAYQGALGLPVAALMTLNAFAPRPDLLFLLDLDPQISHQRIQARGDLPNAFEDLINLQRCRDIFLSLQLPHTVTLDARQSADSIATLAVDHVEQRLKHRAR